jgi:hypothetical protein
MIRPGQEVTHRFFTIPVALDLMAVFVEFATPVAVS